MTTQEKIAALRELLGSNGWKVVAGTLRAAMQEHLGQLRVAGTMDDVRVLQARINARDELLAMPADLIELLSAQPVRDGDAGEA